MAFTSNISGNIAYLAETATYNTGMVIGKSNVRIIGIIMTPNHATNDGNLELAQNNSDRGYLTLVKFKAIAEESSLYIDLNSNPLVFTDGIYVKTMSYADVTLILDNNSQR